jgi:hypothetical protein
LDFGDGDFYVLDVRRLEAPRTVDYDWRFVGIGPSSRISWTINRLDECECEIDVRDGQRERPRVETLTMAARWADSLGRLTRFLSTGAWSRHASCRDIEASIELPVRLDAARTLLEPAGHHQWLPVSEEGLVTGAAFQIKSDRSLEVLDVERADRDTLSFRAGLAGIAGTTSCALRLRGRARDVLLEVHHSGFGELGLGDAELKRLRARAARTWISALERGRVSAGTSAAVSSARCA